MSRFELVGLFDCPGYAKAEKIADEIAAQNPNCEFNKEMLDLMHWKEFVVKMNMRQGWDIKQSPCVYEILAEREAKVNLIGDINDFCEFALLYFNISFDPNTTTLKGMVAANRALHGRGHHGTTQGGSEIMNIAIINAPILTLELMLTQLLSPMSIFPHGILLQISIFDEYSPKRILDGLMMEVMDMASPLLYKAQVVTTLPTAFFECHLLILMEDFSRALVEDTKEWLDRVEFKIVRIMNSFNTRRTKVTDCRILVGGDGPCTYAAEICRKMTPYTRCGPGKIIASGQHVVQRAKAELAKTGSLPSGSITRLHAYGWAGLTGCYVEVKDATVRGGHYSMRGPGVEIPLAEIATRSNYIYTKFSSDYLSLQKQRLANLVKQPNLFMCMAESAITTIHTWLMCDPVVRIMGEGNFSMTPSAAELYADGMQTSDLCFPVINAGIECSEKCDFPPGTFMIQPAVCVSGRWQPLGKVSTKTLDRITLEVSKLWEIRQRLIYRDLDITRIFPDYEELTTGVNPAEKERREEEEEMRLLTGSDEHPGEDYTGYIGSHEYSTEN